LHRPIPVRWFSLAVALAVVAGGGMAAGCAASEARPDGYTFVGRTGVAGDALDSGLFTSNRAAVPLVIYDQPVEAHRTDRVAARGSEARAVAVQTSVTHTPDAVAARKAASVDPPLAPVRLAAAPPPPVVVGGGVVAYNVTVGAIPVGAAMDVRATVSADRRYVYLNLNLQNVTAVQFRQVPLVVAVP
jgi:hypothetical protein